MKKLFYIVLVIVILMVIGRLLKKEHNTLNAEPAVAAETTGQNEEKTAPKIQAVIEEQSVVTEDEDGNMSVDGEVVEDIEEENPSATANDGETIINE